MSDSASKETWIELEEGFYILETARPVGITVDTDAMKRQADEAYEEVKKAFKGNIKFVE